MIIPPLRLCSYLFTKCMINYLYTTVKLCEALLDGVATDDTLIVAIHQCCCGRFTNCRLLAADIEIIAALWAIFALFVWSTKVVSIVIPFEEGIIEVRVAVTANPLVNEILLLEVLIVNATGVSVGEVGGGVGVEEPPPSEDLEQDIIENITIDKIKNIFFIFIFSISWLITVAFDCNLFQ